MPAILMMTVELPPTPWWDFKAAIPLEQGRVDKLRVELERAAMAHAKRMMAGARTGAGDD